MAANLENDGGYASEINITPLVDVVLVLLIIFMMIVPVLLHGYDVDVPGEAIAAAPRDSDDEQIVLQIDLAACPALEPPAERGLPAACAVRLNGAVVPVADLAGRIGAVFADREPSRRVLFLAAQGRLNYEAVLRIVDIAKSRVDGLRIGLVTE